jgi:hypothetical protein
MKTRVASLVGVVFLSSCLIQPIKGSSRALLTESGSMLVTELPRDEVAKALVAQLGKRGFTISDRREVGAGDVILKFKGWRATIHDKDGPTRDVGSVFYALLSAGNGQTRVHLFGKPTFDGLEMCSDEDDMAPMVIEKCFPVMYPFDWKGLSRTTGREEAEVIESVALELEVLGVGKRPAGEHAVAAAAKECTAAPGTAVTCQPVPTPQPACTRKAGETTADALERCRHT